MLSMYAPQRFGANWFTARFGPHLSLYQSLSNLESRPDWGAIMLGMKLPCTWPVSSSTRTPTTTRETYQTHLVADCLGCRIVGLASATTIGAQETWRRRGAMSAFGRARWRPLRPTWGRAKQTPFAFRGTRRGL